MNVFMQTLLIAVIPSTITGILSFLASYKNANVQIKAIKEQNKADIDKLIEQNKVDIEALKEKHKLELEIKEKEHSYQIELIKIQHENGLKKDEETMKNQFAMNTLGGLFGSIFTQNSFIAEKINEAMEKGLEDAMAKKEE